MSKPKLFATEAELVAAFSDCIDPKHWARNPNAAPKWVAYHETADWDLLLVHPDGWQIGVEAKLTLNPKVLEQALPGCWADDVGPDFRAVLVPEDGLQNHMHRIALHLGIVVLTVGKRSRYSDRPAAWDLHPSLPDPSGRNDSYELKAWPNWMPSRRCKLPDYVPDVTGGHAAPLRLSEWKIKAIKLLILLDRTGAVTRADMKALGISPTRWTDHWSGFLSPGPNGGYVRNGRTPDLKAQHPVNWAQIEADFDKWSKGLATAARLGLEVAP